ncbi:glycosyltransferase family 4 protein [Nucisporomicrobium flavum]|uniref:glycosyltransferase family 4 protein n=1 Tax=Nucisporomicrobium flavum TaxID=2785915 RepID=UPI0018F437B8|nr:glycosyltransferase family 4 protein [Nucisporomicrobium flavum]
MSRPIRVLLMVENVALARDHRLRKHAAALVAAGLSVTVVCRRDPGNRGVPGVRVFDYPPPRDGTSKLGFAREYLYSLLMAAALTVRAMLAGGVDVVQISSTPDLAFVLAVPLRLLGRTVVFDFKDLSPEMYAARYGTREGLMYALLQRFEHASLRTADHVVAVNASVREVAMRRGGVPATGITVVGNGPPLAALTARTPDPALRRGHEHLCVLAGMMGPQDSIHLAVEAVARVVHERGRTDTAFTFIGAGDAVPDLRRLATRLGLNPWVTFPGWVEQERLFDHLATADLGLEPNLEDFVTPVKALEYMAFGLPFVAFDVAETRLVAEGAAELAPPGDVAAFAALIDGLLADPARRAALGATGRRVVSESLAWEHQARRYLTVFEVPRAGRRAQVRA